MFGAASTPASAADDAAAKTLVIGIDGAAFDFLDAADMPNLDALRSRSMVAASNLPTRPMADTSSGPGWSTIATGVWPDRHGVADNSFSGSDYSTFPDYLTRVESEEPSRRTAAIATWAPIVTTIFGPAVDSRVSGGNDAGTTTAAVDAVASGADDVFVQLDEVDGAGHGGGTNGAAYGRALATADAQLGRMLAAVDARPDSEQWTVIVTSDHGHTPTGGHGGSSAAERKVFVVASGPGITPGTRFDVKSPDIAATALAAAGITTVPTPSLDGTAIGRVVPDAFDALRPVLKTRVDETRPGASVLGWTHATPQGWSIDNSRMPTGGVTEWAGWSFATDEFWTAAEPGQRRETSVRSRNVFAVADSDEWDDKAHATGQFDSTLISPALDLNGSATATLSFATNYVIDGPQSAQVSVSFDGGSPRALKTYTANTNTHERVSFEVPAGARKATFSFRYTGQNSAFWVVDQVALGQSAAVADTVKPATTLVAPTSAGPSSTLALQVDATDDRGLERVVANIYRKGTLVKSTQTAARGATSATHRATITLPDGVYTVRYNAQDLAGNISTTRTFDTTIDATAPKVTVKNGPDFTVGADGRYTKVSFKLQDAGKIDRVTVNGVAKNLTDNAFSDLNFLRPGVFGAVAGPNTLEVFDVAGNRTTVEFELD